MRNDADQECLVPPASVATSAAVVTPSHGEAAIRDPRDAGAPAPPETIEQFLGAIGARAFRFAELGLRQRDDALDAVQDAMLRMLGYRERPPAEWTPLFWSILRRRIIDLQRRRAFRMRWLSPPPASTDESARDVDWIDAGAGPSQRHDDREGYARIATVLSTLPRRQREAFTLRVLEDLDVAATARVMGCSEGSVKTHLSRAREVLKRELEEFQ